MIARPVASAAPFLLGLPLVPLLAFALGTGDTLPLTLLLTVLSVLCLAPVLVPASPARGSLFDPWFLAAAMMVMGYVGRTIHLVWSEGARLDGVLLDRQATLVLLSDVVLLAIAGAGFLLLGWLAPWGGAIARSLPTPSREPDPARLRQVWILLTVVGALAFGVFVARAGGLSFLVTNLELRTELASGRHALTWGIRLLALGVIFRQIERLIRPRRRGRIGFALHLVLVLGALAAMGSRAWPLEAMFVLLAVRHFLGRPARRSTYALLAAGGLLLFALGSQYRALTHGGLERHEWRSFSLEGGAVYEGLLGRHNFDLADNLAVVLHHAPDRLGHRYGTTYAHLFVNAVPRAYWEGKPVGIGTELAREIYGWKGGAPAGFVGELYLNFGVVGVLAGMLALGVFARGLGEYGRVHRGRALPAILVAISLVFLVMLIRGVFFTVTTTYLMRLIPVGIGMAYAITRPRSGR